VVGFNWYVSKPYGPQIHAIFVFMAIPCYHNTYLWRGYQLYVLYNLTEYRAVKEGAENTEEVEEATRNWLVRRTQSVSQDNLWKSYLIVNAPIAIIFPIIGALLDIKIGTRAFIVIAIISISYAFAEAALAFLLRNVQDAFFLQREIIANAILNICQSITMLYFGNIHPIKGFNYPFILIICYTLRMPLNMFIPLFMSYRASAWKSSSNNSGTESGRFESVTENSNNKIKVTKKYNTLDSIMDEEAMYVVFVVYLKRRFQIQLLLFLEHLKAFKACEKQVLAGKAFLLFQKFIKPSSLLDLSVPKDIIESLEKTINDEQKLLEEGAFSAHFFDDVETYVRQQLEQPVHLFRETEEYKRALTQLNEAAKINTGLVTMGIVN